MEYYLLALLLLLPLLVYRAISGCCIVDLGLRLPPGPWQLPVIGSLHHLFGDLPHRALRDLSRRHGPLMLIKLGGSPVIIASGVEAAKEIMKTHDINFCTRPLSSCVKIICKHSKGIAFAPYGDQWRQLRKICFLEVLSAKRISSFRLIHEEDALRFMRSISLSVTEEPVVNMSKMLAMHVTNTTMHTVMGGRFKEHDTLLRHVHEAVQIVGGITLSDLFPSSRLARALCGSTLRRADVLRDTMTAFLEGVIAEHLEMRRSSEVVSQEEDLVDVLLRIKREGNLEFSLTMSEIKHVIFDLIGAGTETAQTTLQWAMAELMLNPSVMARVQTEVRGAFMSQVTEDGLGDLSYMRCVIKETLRLHTPTPLLLPRECQQQCRILGYDVPKGATVLVNAWAIARDPECWDDPEAFHPDRFLGSTIDFKGNNFEFIPFGAGRRICPGIQFGIANIELALASLLFYFEWSLPDGILPGQLDMTETMGATARKRMDLWLQPTLRIELPR